MKACVFCTDPAIQKRTIVKNKLSFAFPTSMPIVPGHILLCPIRHISSFDKLTKEERTSLSSLMNDIKQALIKSFHAQGFNYAWNEGAIAGQTVAHLHLHIVPRIEGDTGIWGYEPRNFLYRPGERPTSPDEELLQITQMIQNNL